MGGQFQITADLCAQLISSINPHGYLRIQLEMNQRYDRQKGSKKLVRLPKDKQVNVYTKEYLDEAMDRADLQHVQNLIETTTAFLNSTNCYRKIDDVECSVERAIENFIEANR